MRSRGLWGPSSTISRKRAHHQTFGARFRLAAAPYALTTCAALLGSALFVELADSLGDRHFPWLACARNVANERSWFEAELTGHMHLIRRQPTALRCAASAHSRSVGALPAISSSAWRLNEKCGYPNGKDDPGSGCATFLRPA